MNRNRVKELLPEIQNIITQTENYMKKVESGTNTFDDRQKIIRLIDNLDFYDVFLLEAVMYIGRDDYINPDSYEYQYDYYEDLDNFYREFNSDIAIRNMIDHLLRQGMSKSEVIDHMLAKKPLAKYIQQGLEVLRVVRINEGRFF